MKDRVTLNHKEQARAKVVMMAIEGRCTTEEAAKLLQLSRRHVKRLKKALREEGPAGLAHGNRGREPAHAIRESERREILELASTLYSGYNHTHLHEELVTEQGIRLSRRSVARILTAAGLRSPRRHRPRRHRAWRERLPKEGMMLQVDGSHHDWLEGRGPRLVLLGAVDDATGELVHALFREQEDAQGYLMLLREVVRKRGIPLAWYSDRHGIFVRNDKEPWTLSEELAGRREPTQVARALEELGVNLILARTPQAKGRVERCWETLQDRLVKELRRANACTLAEANQTLKRYLPRFKERFARPPADPEPAYRQLSRGTDVDAVCSFHYGRTVANDNTVRLEERLVHVPPGPGGRSYAGCRVQLQERLDGSLAVLYQGRLIAHAPAPSKAPLRARRRRRESERTPALKPEQLKLQPATSPPAAIRTAPAGPAPDHPWRRPFRRQVTKSQAS
jgi:transposase